LLYYRYSNYVTNIRRLRLRYFISLRTNTYMSLIQLMALIPNKHTNNYIMKEKDINMRFIHGIPIDIDLMSHPKCFYFVCNTLQLKSYYLIVVNIPLFGP
jgi:hypothetical protein